MGEGEPSVTKMVKKYKKSRYMKGSKLAEKLREIIFEWPVRQCKVIFSSTTFCKHKDLRSQIDQM